MRARQLLQLVFAQLDRGAVLAESLYEIGGVKHTLVFAAARIHASDSTGLSVINSHQVVHKQRSITIMILGCPAEFGYCQSVTEKIGGSTVTKKIAVVAVLCAVVALVACRREEYRPLKLGGPVAEQPAR